MWDFMKGKLTLSIRLFWKPFDMFTSLGEKAELVTTPVKIFIRPRIDQCINVAHPRRVTLFLIRLLTIIDRF